MSGTDSFIEEVSEEVRRDKLFAKMRKYGWIAVLLVLATSSAGSILNAFATFKFESDIKG